MGLLSSTWTLRTASSIAGTTILLAGCTSAHHPAATASTAGHSIVFQVDGHGTADINFTTGTGTSSPAGSQPHAALPWHTAVHGGSADATLTLTVVLNQPGSQAECSITMDGRRVTASTAHGSYARATCRSDIPADDPGRSDG